jgi:short chain dehydrogenase
MSEVWQALHSGPPVVQFSVGLLPDEESSTEETKSGTFVTSRSTAEVLLKSLETLSPISERVARAVHVLDHTQNSSGATPAANRPLVLFVDRDAEPFRVLINWAREYSQGAEHSSVVGTLGGSAALVRPVAEPLSHNPGYSVRVLLVEPTLGALVRSEAEFFGLEELVRALDAAGEDAKPERASQASQATATASEAVDVDSHDGDSGSSTTKGLDVARAARRAMDSTANNSLPPPEATTFGAFPSAGLTTLSAEDVRRLSSEDTHEVSVSTAEEIFCYMCHHAIPPSEVKVDVGSGGNVPLCAGCDMINAEKRAVLRGTSSFQGKVAVVTGARVKIGAAVMLHLLLGGATVIATTRFPADLVRRVHRHPRFSEFGKRLVVYRLDLRHAPRVLSFARWLAQSRPRVDILINNAARPFGDPQRFIAT